jgi:hypothetical protein
MGFVDLGYGLVLLFMQRMGFFLHALAHTRLWGVFGCYALIDAMRDPMLVRCCLVWGLMRFSIVAIWVFMGPY